MNLRSFIKRTKAGQLIWRIFIGVLGGTITVLGAIALVAPGPGVLILLARYQICVGFVQRYFQCHF